MCVCMCVCLFERTNVSILMWKTIVNSCIFYRI